MGAFGILFTLKLLSTQLTTSFALGIISWMGEISVFAWYTQRSKGFKVNEANAEFDFIKRKAVQLGRGI